MKTYTTILLLTLVAAISSPVMAHYDDDGYTGFDQRIERQQKRINKGVRNGELTNRESRKLRKQQRYIKKINRQFKKDGHLSHHERKNLKRKLNLASKRIYRLKHNDRYRNNNSHDQGHNKKKYSGNTHRHHDHDHERSAQLNYRNYY